MDLENTFAGIMSGSSPEDYSSSLPSSEHSQHAVHNYDYNIPNVPAAETIRYSNWDTSNLAVSPNTSSQHFNGYHYPIVPDTYSAPLLSSQDHHPNGIQMPYRSQVNTPGGPLFNNYLHGQLNIHISPQIPTRSVFDPQSWGNTRHIEETKLKRHRTVFTTNQLFTLENYFKENNYLERNKRREIADSLGLKEDIIKVWYQNRRMKDKRNKDEQQLSPELVPNVLSPGTHYVLNDNEGFQVSDPISENRDNVEYMYMQSGSNSNLMYPHPYQILTTDGELPQLTILPGELDHIV